MAARSLVCDRNNGTRNFDIWNWRILLLGDVQKFSFGSCCLRSINFFERIFQIFTGVVFLYLLAFL